MCTPKKKKTVKHVPSEIRLNYMKKRKNKIKIETINLNKNKYFNWRESNTNWKKQKKMCKQFNKSEPK